MDERPSQFADPNTVRVGNFNGKYEKFIIRLIYVESIGNSQLYRDLELNNTDCFYLKSDEEQKILSEVQVKSHLWSVTGKVIDRIGRLVSETTYRVVLHVYVQPALRLGESATLEISHANSRIAVLELACSIPCNKYEPYTINITIPAVPISLMGNPNPCDFFRLTLTLGTEGIKEKGVSLTEKQSHPAPMNTFLEYSNELFLNHELSDVTLKIRGKEFPAHKLLLSSLSPVFKTTFLSDFRESHGNVVEIKDFEFEVIREMLKFMYTHKLPQFRSPDGNIDTPSLYKAAHKYEIQYLLESCTEELWSTVTIKSAWDVLLLADIHDDARLKEKVLDFICKNPPTVDDVSKYEEIVRQRPGLMKDILTCKFKQK